MIDRESSFSFLFRKGGILILAFCLASGLFSGSWLQQDGGSSLVSLMRVSAGQNVSIVSRLSVLLLPFFVSAFVCGTWSCWMILPLSFLKGLCFGFSQAVICASFSGAGWLVYFFLMFSDILTLPVLVFFWIRCFSAGEHMISRLLICVLTVLIITAVDQQFINPYCVSLFI